MACNNLDGTIEVAFGFLDINAEFKFEIELDQLAVDEETIRENDEGAIHDAIYDLVMNTPRDVLDYTIEIEEEEEEEGED
tara:strand:+ start:127 stop:366 length:240 start_codon:yes stop_codon:yes gene_type:complete